MSQSIQVGLLGHWGGNIGHEIMTIGVEAILRRAFGDQVTCERIEQHRPFDIYPAGHLLRRPAFLQHGRGGGAAKLIKGLINRTDISTFLWRSSWVGRLNLGIACGGPLIAPHMAQGDLQLVYQHMFGAFANKKVPLLNLSVGACYPWEKIPESITEKENIDFLKRVFEYSSVTTVRDKLAQHLCRQLGELCELVRDTGFVAGRTCSEWIDHKVSPGYILINYQKYGANETWGQEIDPNTWRNTLRSLIERLRSRYKIIFMCHSAQEFNQAQELDPSIARYQPTTMQEYAQVISGAIAGVCNRLHAALPLAGIGVPAIGVGTDSRLGTLEIMGLPIFYVKEINCSLLEETLENLISRQVAERERLISLREETLQRYVEIVKNAVHF